jgi:hypothetical protein
MGLRPILGKPLFPWPLMNQALVNQSLSDIHTEQAWREMQKAMILHERMANKNYNHNDCVIALFFSKKFALFFLV